MDKMLGFKINLSVLESVFQRTLSEYLNTQTIQNLSGREALQSCFDAAKVIKQERNSSVIPYQELNQYKNIYIVFQVIEQLKKLWLKPLLVTSIDNVNLFNQSGDVSSSDVVEIETEGDASFTGQNVSGNEGITISAGGTLTRKTLKTRKAFQEGEASGTVESLEPQQTFYSRDGFVATFGKNLNHELSTLTVARGNVSRSSAHQLLLEAHTLKREKQWGDHKNGGSSTAHTFTKNQTTTGGVATFNLNDSEGEIRLINPDVQATDIVFNGGTVEVSGSKAVDVRDTIETHKKMFSRRTVKEHMENVVFQAANLNAKRSVQFTEKTKQARLVGTQVKARKVVNQTALAVMPLVGTSLYQTEQFQGNRFASSKVSADQGQEVMLETILDVEEIFTQNAPLKLISAKMRENTTIDGVYEEAIQHLDSWSRMQKSGNRIPPPVMAVLAIGLATISGGAGASMAGFFNTTGLATTAVSSTVTSLCSMIGSSLVYNGGDIQKTLRDIVSFNYETLNALLMVLSQFCSLKYSIGFLREKIMG